jgi:hypothetical protein
MKLPSVRFTPDALWELTTEGNGVIFAATVALALLGLFIGIIAVMTVAFLFYLVMAFCWRYLWKARTRRYTLVHEVAQSIDYAAKAYGRAPGSAAQQDQLRSLAISLAGISKSILAVTDVSKSVTRRSHRKATLRKHHLQVIAALQEKERVIDTNVRAALPDLAQTLTRIANSYSEGKIGELLPVSEVGSLHPAHTRNFEPLKMILTALLLSGFALLVTMLDVPEAATTSLVGAAGIAAVSVVYGTKARQGLDILDSVRGIQRP